MSEDLKAYLFEQVEHHLGELRTVLDDNDYDRINYHIDQVESLVKKLRSE